MKGVFIKTACFAPGKYCEYGVLLGASILKTKVSVEDHSFPNKKIREEILDEIDDIFQEFFPRINLDTKFTGVWNGYLQDPDDYVFYI